MISLIRFAEPPRLTLIISRCCLPFSANTLPYAPDVLSAAATLLLMPL